MIEKRPWGTFEVLKETPSMKMKELIVFPGGRLSLQSHNHRSEMWYVVSGRGTMQYGEDFFTIDAHDVVEIEVGVKHRVENSSKIDVLIIVEVQHGTSFDENDIVRYSDDYGRV